MSRCLTANAPFLPTLAAGAVLVGLQILLAALAMRWDLIGFLAKGREVKLMEGGVMLGRNLRRVRVTEQDLKEQLRLNMKTEDFKQVEHAYLERSGEISFIRE